jgi:hypothetical protein
MEGGSAVKSKTAQLIRCSAKSFACSMKKNEGDFAPFGHLPARRLE